ncbi:HNH endonuclease signature motif containing protein, partial [Mycobacterium sp. E1319]|uniref:HNH endonuclease signature motif containing protein n=1 Tax=Mycobacterium sp. E1319 TaxID=1834124 RepID=UPI0007FF3788
MAAFDAIEAAVGQAAESHCATWATNDKFAVLERVERVRRMLPALEHPVINALARDAAPHELVGKLSHALAERTLISRAEAARRVGAAADLGPRVGLTGQPLPPLLAAAAAAQRAGELGGEQVAVIRRFYHQLPGCIDAPTREHTHTLLTDHARRFRPEQLSALAATLTDCLNPDGTYHDADRARRRAMTLGPQQPDGTSELRAVLTPEARATLEAVLAKLAAPGMCNPDQHTPCVDGTPSQEAIDGDHRSTPQRHHDALLAALRALLASGDLGRHHGLPATIIITTTLAELQAAAGTGRTGGTTTLPISDVIRLASHAHHYLAVFDNAKPVALYHSKRLASPGQRIMLHAKDRGCTAPGCTTAGYYTEVHHVTDYAHTHRTDIDDLTFACGPHHRLL